MEVERLSGGGGTRWVPGGVRKGTTCQERRRRRSPQTSDTDTHTRPAAGLLSHQPGLATSAEEGVTQEQEQ